MKVNKGSGQKSLRSKESHDKKLSQSGVKNTGMQNGTQQAGKGSLGHMNLDEDDMKNVTKK